jgi:hypothetical protein
MNKKTGFLIDSSPIFGSKKKNLNEYYKELDENYKKLSRREECIKFVPEFTKKCEILIKNRKLLDEMKKKQKSLVEKGGKFSLDKRNKRLLELINPHII